MSDSQAVDMLEEIGIASFANELMISADKALDLFSALACTA